MPSIQEIRNLWGFYSSEWENYGNQWSKDFGSTVGEWYTFIYPRIFPLLKNKGVILEIAQGCGRWTYFLKDIAKKYYGVDLSEYCTYACYKRFKNDKNVYFYQNDGKDLSFIKDNSIDFIFSFDSLVYADFNVMNAYIEQIKKKLKQKSYAFIHHSNLGMYNDIRLRTENFDSYKKHWRSEQVSHLTVQELCKENNLHVISQELLSWQSNDAPKTDCISVILNNDSIRKINTKIFEDNWYHKTAEYSRFLFENYNLKDVEIKRNCK